MKEEKTHTRNQRRMYRIHKLEEKIHNQDLVIGSLQSQLKAKEEVIKEAREYVNHSKKNIDESGMYVETYTKWKLVPDVLDDLLEILSKGENK